MTQAYLVLLRQKRTVVFKLPLQYNDETELINQVDTAVQLLFSAALLGTMDRRLIIT